MGAAPSAHQYRQRRAALRRGNACVSTCPGLKPKHVKTLYKLFRRADKDRSGEISVLEFLMFFDIDRTVFAVKAFTHMDDDKSGEIDFPEFVRACWAFVSLSKEGLRHFAFSIYDLDDSGTIDRFEVEAMVHELYGSRWRKNRLARQTLKELSRGPLTRLDFVSFARTHPALLFPAFQLQGALRKALGGARMWTSIEQTRARAAVEPPRPDPVARGARMAQHAATDAETPLSPDDAPPAPRRFARPGTMAPSASRLRLDELMRTETRPRPPPPRPKQVLDASDIRNWRDGAPHLDLARNSQLVKRKVDAPERRRPPRPELGEKENWRPKGSQFEARRGSGDQFGPRTSAVEKASKRRPLTARAPSF